MDNNTESTCTHLDKWKIMKNKDRIEQHKEKDLRRQTHKTH